MAASSDRLSSLHDDLLRRVLHFIPAREAASTTALSRRWRPLWPSSGAINLVARIYRTDEERYNVEAPFYARRDAFVSGAHAALDAFAVAAEADGHIAVSKLTLRVEAREGNTIRDFLHRDPEYRREHNVLAGVLSHPAACGVEELRIAAVDSIDGKPMYFEGSKYEASSNIYGLGIFPLSLGYLPSETLRVLDLTNCSDLAQASPPAIFPRLAALRLRHCNVPLKGLQRIVDAAPLLGSIHLESVLLEDDERYNQPSYQDCIVRRSPEQGAHLRSLRCPAATALVIHKCSLKEDGTIEIYAPMLRRFQYTGVLRYISLSPPPRELARADMTLIDYGCVRDRDPRAARRSFWRFVHGFSHAKEVKLRLRHLEEIAVASEASQVKLLPSLIRLERLEVEGVYRPTSSKAAEAIANLLRCCPALRDLRLKLSTVHEDSSNTSMDYALNFLEMKYQLDFEESVRRSKRHRTQPVVAARDKRDDANYDEVSHLPGLSGRTLECLQSCLTRVSLQFRRQEKDCFGVRLAKFFVENMKVMEKICVDAGNERISEHLNLKMEQWIADSSKRRRMNSTSATKVQVLPLTRRS